MGKTWSKERKANYLAKYGKKVNAKKPTASFPLDSIPERSKTQPGTERVRKVMSDRDVLVALLTLALRVLK